MNNLPIRSKREESVEGTLGVCTYGIPLHRGRQATNPTGTLNSVALSEAAIYVGSGSVLPLPLTAFEIGEEFLQIVIRNGADNRRGIKDLRGGIQVILNSLGQQQKTLENFVRVAPGDLKPTVGEHDFRG
jgi:hypothetical protein